MNTDSTLVPPPVWTGANAGSACICVYPFLSAFISVPISWFDGDSRRRVSNADGDGPVTLPAAHVGYPRRTIELWPTVRQPHRTICVLCVHLLTSALNPSCAAVSQVSRCGPRLSAIAASRSIIGRGVDLRKQMTWCRSRNLTPSQCRRKSVASHEDFWG